MAANRSPTSRRQNPTLARALSLLKAGGDVRAQKVRKLKTSLRVNRYENDLKLTIAAERLLGEL